MAVAQFKPLKLPIGNIKVNLILFLALASNLITYNIYWSPIYQLITLVTNETIDERLIYINNNKVETGFVKDAVEWI